MDISSVNSDLIRGNVTTIILGSLWNRDRYGYDILKEIETKSEGQYKLKQPTLYNQLKRLEKQGLISSYEGDPEDTGGGRRRYYSLTAEGRSFLEKERSEYEYSRTILDKLVSARQFDFDTTPAPFNTDDLRPYIKKDNSDKQKVVYREKEKVVLVEKKIYIDADGNEITEEEAQRLAAEGGRQPVGVSQEEFDRIQAEKQAEIERIEEEKQAELRRIEEEKQAELERADEEKRAELERIRAEKEAELIRIEEEKREELERLAEEARLQRERLEAEHAEEIERLRTEKEAAEHAYAEKEAEYSARRIEELERIAAEREDAERRFKEEYEKFEQEKREEAERREKAERIEAERKAELERIEAERLEAEERFAKEREEFLAEKAAEEERRAAFEREEAERREQAEREAREREEALRSQATMSLDDVFRELDAKSEYSAAAPAEDVLIVEEAKWHVEEPLPAEMIEEEEAAHVEAEEDIPEEAAAPAREEPAEAPDDEAVETASLDEIFRTLDTKSEYASSEEGDENYRIDDAEWHVAQSFAEEVAPEDEPTAPAEENSPVTAEELSTTDEGTDRIEDERFRELARLEAERKAELERIARELESLKAKLDAPRYIERHTEAELVREASNAKSENVYSSTAYEDRQEINYFSADTSARRAPEATMSDVFRILDEKEAKIDSKNAESERYDAEPEHDTRENVAADVAPAREEEDKGEFVVSAVRNKRTEAFDYEKENVNYRDFFSSIAETQEEKAETPAERTLPRPETDLKSRLYSEGFKMRPYDRGNTSEYYTFNFINANRLSRDSWLIVLAIFLIETAIMWACLAKAISYVYFLPIMAGGAALMLIPTFIWMANPSRRKRADFNVRLSVLNRGMMLIELAVVLVLIAFFGVGVSVNDTTLILETMVLPIVLLTNLPISSLVYWLLYRSKKYHTA